VGYTVNIPLEAGANAAFLFLNPPAFGSIREDAVRSDHNVLQLFAFFSGTGHTTASFPSIRNSFYYLIRSKSENYFFEKIFFQALFLSL
jgi:hypothetical protein